MNRYSFACVLFCLASCSPNIMSAPSDDMPTDATERSTPPPQIGWAGDGNTTPSPNTPLAEKIDLLIQGPGSVRIGEVEYRGYLGADLVLRNIPLNGNPLFGASDPGAFLKGWFGPCEPTKDLTTCRPLAQPGITPRIDAIFSTNCSPSGWCTAQRVALPAGASIISALSLDALHLAFLGSDNILYTIREQSGTIDSTRLVFEAGSGIYATSMCQDPKTGDIIVPSTAGYVASVPQSGITQRAFVEKAGEPWKSVSCAADGTVCLTGGTGRLFCKSAGGTWSKIPLDTGDVNLSKTSFSTVHITSHGHKVIAGLKDALAVVGDSLTNYQGRWGETSPDWLASAGDNDSTWIVGSNSAVSHLSTAGVLSRVNVPSLATGSTATEYLTAVATVPGSPGEMYAVGGNGLIVRCTPTGCTRETSGTTLWLSAVTVTPHTVVACGAQGTCIVKQR